MINATKALRAIEWEHHEISAIENPRIGRLAARLRISRLSNGDLRRALRLFALPSDDFSQISRFDLERWRSLIVRFNLYDTAPPPFQDWTPILRHRGNPLIPAPAIWPRWIFRPPGD